MVFGPDDQRAAELTLCFFPHLDEFIVVDARRSLPDRPRVVKLRAGEVLNSDFYGRVESDFSQLLRRTDQPFLKLMGLPQEVEGLIRMHGLRAILERLADGAGSRPEDLNATVAVIFCTGPFLALQGDNLRRAIKKIFAGQLADSALENCASAISELVDRERSAFSITPGADMQSLIRGDTDRYATLWQKDRE